MASDGIALNPLPLKDPQGGALSLTRVSGVGAAIVALLTTVNGSWNAIFGTNTPAWAKPAFLMAVAAAWAFIAAADILSRGYVAGQRGGPQVAALPRTLPAIDLRGRDQACQVTALRVDPSKPDQLEFLIVEAGGGAEWVAAGELSFEPVTA